MAKNKLDELPQFMIKVEVLPASGITVRLKHDEADHALVRDLLQVENLLEFEALLEFKRWAKKGVRVDGKLKASVETLCPASLELVSQNVDTHFNAKFVPADSSLAKPQINAEGEMVISPDGDDIPDVYESDELDAWAIALEYMALEIDPFARKDGANFDDHVEGHAEDDENLDKKDSPFAVLKGLKP